MGSGGIDVFLQADELHALLCQTGNDGQQIPGVSGDTGDALHDHRVAGTDESHHGFEILPVRILAAGLKSGFVSMNLPVNSAIFQNTKTDLYDTENGTF